MQKCPRRIAAHPALTERPWPPCICIRLPFGLPKRLLSSPADEKADLFSGGHGRTSKAKPALYKPAQIYLCGPMNFNDPYGNRCASLALNETEDKFLFEQLSAKSVSSAAMNEFLGLVRAQAPKISVAPVKI